MFMIRMFVIVLPMFVRTLTKKPPTYTEINKTQYTAEHCSRANNDNVWGLEACII